MTKESDITLGLLVVVGVMLFKITHPVSNYKCTQVLTLKKTKTYCERAN